METDFSTFDDIPSDDADLLTVVEMDFLGKEIVVNSSVSVNLFLGKLGEAGGEVEVDTSAMCFLSTFGGGDGEVLMGNVDVETEVSPVVELFGMLVEEEGETIVFWDVGLEFDFELIGKFVVVSVSGRRISLFLVELLSPLSSLFDTFKLLIFFSRSILGSLKLASMTGLFELLVVSMSLELLGGKALLRVLQQIMQTRSLASFKNVQYSQAHSSLTMFEREVRFEEKSRFSDEAVLSSSSLPSSTLDDNSSSSNTFEVL